MRVADIGEFQLIDILAKTVASRSAARIPKRGESSFRIVHSIGDDAAAWWSGQGASALTTDTMVEGAHFQRGLMSWRDLGWKSMAVNMSDVAAMGCEPSLSVITLGLVHDIEVESVLEMYEGMLDACGAYGGAIVGGDVVKSPALFVTAAMVGDAGPSERPMMTRSAAAVGDLVAVTGSLGRSAAALRLLLAGVPNDDHAHASLMQAHLRPTPRVAEGAGLRRLGALAAMDVSDGLAADLQKMCAASGVGARIHAARIPVDEDTRRAFPDDWQALALNGGEDYELVFTAPPDVVREARETLATPIAIIGEVMDGVGVEVIGPSGAAVEVERGGWDHFAPVQ